VSRRRLTLVLPAVVAAAIVLPAPSPFDATARAKTYYCSSRSHPKGCVPPEARRNKRIKPQQKPRVQPPDTVNGGGVGGGGGRREDGAIDWASGFTGSHAWSYRDERFVEEAYATRGRYASARKLRSHVYLHRGPPTLAPRGTLMHFKVDPPNRGLGHVGLSQGNGTMLSALDVVRTTDVVNVPYWNDAYVGWSRAPRAWRGRLPVPFNLLGPIDADSARIVKPAFDEVVTGIVSLEASAPADTAGVGFAAYYSDDPASAAPTWHDLGQATPIGMTYLRQWNSATVVDQGDRNIGTVMIAAITLDAAGSPKGVGDYRRISVDNVR